jgi:hypothetical protein
MKKTSIFAILICFVLAIGAFAQGKAKPQYGGVSTCKACHLTAKSGAQFKLWESSPHAKAFETLKSEAAVKIAKEKGIADATKADACLKCHVTAHGVAAELKGPKLAMEEGVSCEACHGPGSEYKGRQVMLDIYDGKVDGAKYGLVAQTKESCMTCHNSQSPTFKGFDFAEYSKKIAHPTPKK